MKRNVKTAQEEPMVAPEADAARPDSIALRAFAVLEVLCHARGPMSLDDVTQGMGLPKPTVYRILTMLTEAGLLRRDPHTRRYTVGPRLAAFGVALWRNDGLRVPWRQALEQAVAETGESCNLTVLENDRVLYLDQVETDRPLRLHLTPGTRVPLHCTASSKLFLSDMKPEALRQWVAEHPLQRYTPQTITDPEMLISEIDTVRRTRVGLHDSELFEDSVAVPVLDANGRICAALALHAPSSRENIKSCLRHLDVLRRSAAVIAQSMGFDPASVMATMVSQAPNPVATTQATHTATAAPGVPARRRKITA
jgi:DNA-binding IclR family transcriptional regulator